MHCKRRKSPEKSTFLAIFWGFWFSQDRLFSRTSTRKPLNLIKSLIFTNTPCKSGPYPQYGWDFPEEIPEKFRKDPGNALRAFPGIPHREYGWDPQSPIIEGIWGFQSISRILSLPVRLGTPLFSEVVLERASQSWSWNSQQYWGHSWKSTCLYDAPSMHTENVINCRDACRKLSWHFMTTYDDLWRFMTFYVNGTKRRKSS